MSAGYEKAIRAAEGLPHAQVCFDPFHVVKLGGEAADKVRRAEYNKHGRSSSEDGKWIKGARYSLLKDTANQTPRQLLKLAEVMDPASVPGSREIILLYDHACDTGKATVTSVSDLYRRHLDDLGLGAEQWTQSLDLFKACADLHRRPVAAGERLAPTIVPFRLQLMVPYVGVLVQGPEGTRLVLVAVGRIAGDRIESSIALSSSPSILDGVRSGGRYVFLRATSPVGFAAGRVREVFATETQRHG